MKKVTLFIALVLISNVNFSQIYRYESDTNFFEIRNAFFTDFDTVIDTVEGSYYRQFDRWQAFWGPRVAPSGSFKIASQKWNYFLTNDLPNLRKNLTIESNWIELGPDTNGLSGIGRIDELAFHPYDSNIMFAGSPCGGLFKTIDKGESWSNLNTDYQLGRLGVSAISIEPDKPDTIYIGTGDADSEFSYSDGIYRTTDGGQTWIAVNNGLFSSSNGQFTITKILIDPSNDSVMFVATSAGIYKCSNRNESVPQWSKVYPSAANEFEKVRNIVFMNTDPSIIFGVGIDIIKSNQSGSSGTWTRFATSQNGLDFSGTPWPNVLPGEYVDWLDLAISSDDSVIYVNCITRDTEPPYFFDSPMHTHFFRYSIIDDNWDTSNAYPTLTPGRTPMVVDQNDHDIIYAGGINPYRSIDGGFTWTKYSTNAHADYHGMWIAPFNGNYLFLGTDGGLYLKEIGGGSLELNNGLGVATNYNIGSSELIPRRILAGAQDCGINFYNNGVWWHSPINSDGFECLMDYSVPYAMYSTIYWPDNGSLYLSDLSGEPNFEKINKTDDESAWFGAALVMSSFNSSILYQGRQNIWKTTNALNSTSEDWFKISDFKNQLPDTNWCHVIKGLEIAPLDSGIIYTSDVNCRKEAWNQFKCRLLKTTNCYGSALCSWTDITPDQNNTLVINDIAVSDNDSDSIWVCYSGFEQNYKVKFSPNGGQTWVNYNTGLPNIPINCIIYQLESNDALFVGTDVGVYYRNDTMTSWEPFMTNLPNVIVNWLEINYKSNMIRAATFGRGLWESELPGGCPQFENDTLLINDTLTLDGFHRMHKNIVVDSGGLLIVTGRVYMATQSRILVKRGGKLEVNGGLLSSSCDGNFWKGIEVWGTRDSSQYVDEIQGKVMLSNGAIIAGAETGITLIKEDTAGFTDPDFAGGYVIAENASFSNCKVAIKIFPYENFNPMTHEPFRNFCDFKNVNFSCSSRDDSEEYNYPYVFLSGAKGIEFDICDFRSYYMQFDERNQHNSSILFLQNCQDIKIRGCSFSNHTELNIESPSCGIGLYSYNSEFEIEEICTSLIQPCNSFRYPSFTHFNYGIKAYGIDPNRNISIDTTLFNMNMRGLYISGITDAMITRSRFNIPMSYQQDYVHYGVYLDNCTGYKVEENFFEVLTYYPWFIENVGILINNSGSDFNMIYNNSFKRCHYGTLAQGINRDPDDVDNGLKIKCNDYTQGSTDVAVTVSDTMVSAQYFGISRFQGANDPNDITSPAGNLFTVWPPSANYVHYDNETNHIYYFAHDTLQSDDRVNPVYYSSSTITKVNTDHVFQRDSCCPSKLEISLPDTLKKEMNNLSLKIDLTNYQLNMYIDGGDTEELVYEITTSQPNEGVELRSQLLNESPYLSDTSMIEAAGKENVLNSTMIRDVLVANPQAAKSQRIMEVLNDRINPMPQYMIDEINQGIFSVSSKEKLESKLAYYKQERKLTFRKLLRIYLSDTINDWANDSALYLLGNENSLPEFYRFVLKLYELGLSDSAQNQFESIPDLFELSSFKSQEYDSYNDYLEFYSSFSNNDFNFGSIDSLQKETLYLLSENEKYTIGAYARNILQISDTLVYHEPIYLPDNQLKSANALVNDKSLLGNSYLNCFPNPANTYFVIEYAIENEIILKGSIEVINLEGKIIDGFLIDKDKSKDQILYDTRAFEPGAYIIVLIINERVKLTSKITIV